MKSALRFNSGTITHFDGGDNGKPLRVWGIARAAGTLKYHSDSGTRVELVPPALNKALDDQGYPYVRQLGGAVVTREHPPCLIRHDADLREKYQVGEVLPKIKVYHDGKVEVAVEVYDSKTIDDIKSGRKRAFSMGYQVGVEKRDGIWKGQRYTHVQRPPLQIDHLAIVASPRAPEALITRFDSKEDDGFAIAWTTDSEDLDMSLKALLARMDKKATPGAPCGKGWIGTKPNCKRAPKGSGKGSAKKSESSSLGAARSLREKLTGISTSLTDKEKQAVAKKISEAAAAKKKALGNTKSEKQLKKALTNVSTSAKARAAKEQQLSKSTREKMAEKARNKRNRESIRKSLEALGLGGIAFDALNLDSLLMPDAKLYPVIYGGKTYHLDSEDYEFLLDALGAELELNFDDDDENENEDEDYNIEDLLMDSDDEEEEEEEEDEEDEEELMDSYKDLLSAQSKIDALEGQLAIATRLLARRDMEEEEEEEEEELMDSAVQDMVQSIFATYQDARDYLPADFKLDSVTSPSEIMRAAIANFDSELAENLDSEEAIIGAYQVLKTYAGSSSPGVSMLRQAVDSAYQPASKTNFDSVKSYYENAWKGGN